jgi:hypothetical protein
VQRGAGRAELGAQDPAERERIRLDHGDLDAHAARRRRHLSPDEAGTDHHDVTADQQVPAQLDCVLQRPQGVHPAELRSRERPGPRSGGEHHPVGHDLLP